MAVAIKLTNPTVKVIGVEPALAADAQASLRQGKIVNSLPNKSPAPSPTDSAPKASAPSTSSTSVLRRRHRHRDRRRNPPGHEVSRRQSRRRPQTRYPSLASSSTPKKVTNLNIAIISGGNVGPAILKNFVGDKRFNMLGSICEAVHEHSRTHRSWFLAGHNPRFCPKDRRQTCR